VALTAFGGVSRVVEVVGGTVVAGEVVDVGGAVVDGPPGAGGVVVVAATLVVVGVEEVVAGRDSEVLSLVVPPQAEATSKMPIAIGNRAGLIAGTIPSA